MNRPLDAELHAWIDGQLDPQRASEIAAWVAENPEAGAQAQAYRAQREALHRAFDDVLEEPLPPRLLAAASTPAPRRVWRMAAAMAWISLGFAAGYVLRQPALAPPPPALAQRAAIAHAVYVPEVRHPVEVGADQEAHLLQWLSKRLKVQLRAPKFAEFGFTLMGGRLLPGDAGPVAQLMYQDAGGRRLTLYMGSDAGNETTAFRFAQEGKLSVFYWLDGKLGYALSGEMPREEMLKLAQAAYRELNP